MFVIKEAVGRAQESLLDLVDPKISNVFIPISQEHFLKFQNGGCEQNCQEFEEFSKVVILTSEDIDDNNGVFTNKPYKIGTRSETTVVVWTKGEYKIYLRA